MTKLQLAKINLITNHYTFCNQKEIVVEECAELIQAIKKLDRSTYQSWDNFLGEVSDMIICVAQLKSYLIDDKDKINDMVNYKLNRQIGRILEEHSSRGKHKDFILECRQLGLSDIDILSAVQYADENEVSPI